MNKLFGGDNTKQTRFQVAKESVKMLIESKLLYATSHEIGIVLIGTQKSSNFLNDQYEDQYKHVTTFRQIDKLDLESFRHLENITCEKAPIKDNGGDLLDGLIVGMDMMVRHCGEKKYKKRVFLITDGERETKYDPRELKQIITTLNERDTRLNIITLDFCNELAEDDEDDDEEESKKDSKKKESAADETESQNKNKEFLMELTDKVKGAIFPAKVAMEIYKQFKKREVMARVKYRGNLDLAKDLKLNVSIYSRTREEVFPSLKKHSTIANESTSAKESLVKLERQFAEVDDPDQQPVDTDQQIKAYNYGKQLVPVSKENEHILKYKPPKQDDEHDPANDMDVKVQNQSKVPRHHFIAGVDVILPVKGSKNERAFAALVFAMIETHRVLIARIVERKNVDPKLVVLYPHISKKKPLLYMAQIPTNEEIRDYQFPSLIPATKPQKTAAKQLIKALDLVDQEAEEEKLKPEITFNPALQYFSQVVVHRITEPAQQELPQLNQQIAEYVKPDKKLFQQAEDEISAFEEAFELKYNNEDENKKKKRVYWRDIIRKEEEKVANEEQKLEEEEQIARQKIGDKDMDDKEDKIKEISSMNPIEDFKNMVNDRKVDRVSDAIDQMQKLIIRFVTNSLAGDLYSRALDCLIALRESCINEDEGQKFNQFMEKLKQLFSKGTNKEFFQSIIKHKISLITKDESSISSVITADEAKRFLEIDKDDSGQMAQQKKIKQEDEFMDEIE
ncbi:atp-dependent dna helicase [Stylonychia lemnae]|uniref:Atp-dependent dna helicase n=1 Tax=Stylonychia lemnae TaxID=5949 RepID=A0A078A0N2_STYLE|nr:atp-dependent dna helicase [Stylonychia lemnae]|eukprot:CDW74323.1 atp-dependent dna helicase [Stylonychia lemnae]